MIVRVMTMKGFKYKLDLTKGQRLKVDQTLGNARFVFNHFLDRRIKQYEDFKKSGLKKKDFKRFTYLDDAKTLTELKKTEGFEWLKVGANETLQQSLRNLESSYLNFFKQPSKGFPKFKKSQQRNITRVQRKLSKRLEVCKKNKNHLSKRGEKIKLRLAKIHRKVHNQRMDFIHKLTSNLVKRFDCICIEDLNVKGMMQNHNLANSIGDVSWSEFVRVLKYKAEWNGVRIVQIDRFDASSQTCHVCGCKNQSVKDLRIRGWTCPQCGTHHDRDVNAAINIRNFGLNSLSA